MIASPNSWLKARYAYLLLPQIRRQSSVALSYAEYGEPLKVLSRKEETLPSQLKPTQVLVKVLAAPINPNDINTIEGVYPTKSPLPAVPGHEGVAEVIKVGSGVSDLATGDRVIPGEGGLGTWRTHAIWERNKILQVPKDTPVIMAATLAINPCTAYRMLQDFVELKKGDTVIQNAANSAVGQAVIQLAALRGINTINVVRDRPNLAELREFLTELGATHVLTEEEIRSKEAVGAVFKNIPKPKLGFNCVGGKSCTELIRLLDMRGTLVTYGGMSKQPVIAPTSLFIFKDITLKGYWMSHWNSRNMNSSERRSMLDELCTLAKQNKFRPPPVTRVPLDSYQDGVRAAMQSFTSAKQILIMDDEAR